MDLNTVIFDLSSDEDVGWGQNIGIGDDCDRVEDCKWIQDFFNDDSDDVVLVSEVVVKPKDKKLKFSNNHHVKDFNNDDDDDCVILDGDPDKNVEGKNIQYEYDVVQSDSDELLVVGETGQVACRDYPHPRDLCAKFSFTSTPHEQCCNQCHCYVCDSPAPCLQWGTGMSISDHCHATGKEEFWNQQRDNLKKSRRNDLLVPEVPRTSMPTNQIQINQSQTSTPHIQYHIPHAQVPMSAPISSRQYCTSQTQVSAPISQLQYRTSQAQVPRLASMEPCTTVATKMPSIKVQRSGSVMPIDKLPPNLTMQQIRSTGKNILARNRRQTIGRLGPQVSIPTAVFKRRGLSGVALASIKKNGFSNDAHKYVRNPAPMVAPAPGNHTTILSAETNTKSNNLQPSQQYMKTIPSKFIASQPRLPPHLSSQPSVSIPSMNPPQPLLSCHLNARSVLVDSTSQSQIPSHQVYIGGMVVRPNSSQLQVSSQPPNSFGNGVSFVPPVYSHPNHACDGYWNVFQQQNQTSNFEDTSSDLDYVTNKTHDVSQEPQAETFQLQGSGIFDESVPFDEFDCFFGKNSNDGSFNIQFDNWSSDSEELARLSREPGTLDSGNSL